MKRNGGWTRVGSRRHFRYVDGRGKRITDSAKLERIQELAIPPAWKEVWISSRPTAKLQATGVDAAGRRQYLYHEDYRAAQEEAKFHKLVRFADALPAFREAMSKHIELEPMASEWTCAVAVRLINLGWFRVGDGRYTKGAQNLWNHNTSQEPRQGPRQPDRLSLSGQAPHLGADGRGRH